MKQKGFASIIILALIALAIVGFFSYKYFIPRVTNVIPSPPTSSNSDQTEKPNDLPVITDPVAGSKFVSPQKIRGTVPPGWMFEGSFPIKLLDANRKLLVQTTAQEEVPGAWQSNTPVYFTVTLTFTTTAKSGFMVLMNDNPSGDPAKSKTFEVPVNF